MVFEFSLIFRISFILVADINAINIIILCIFRYFHLIFYSKAKTHKQLFMLMYVLKQIKYSSKIKITKQIYREFCFPLLKRSVKYRMCTLSLENKSTGRNLGHVEIFLFPTTTFSNRIKLKLLLSDAASNFSYNCQLLIEILQFFACIQHAASVHHCQHR